MCLGFCMKGVRKRGGGGGARWGESMQHYTFSFSTLFLGKITAIQAKGR